MRGGHMGEEGLKCAKKVSRIIWMAPNLYDFIVIFYTVFNALNFKVVPQVNVLDHVKVRGQEVIQAFVGRKSLQFPKIIKIYNFQ